MNRQSRQEQRKSPTTNRPRFPRSHQQRPRDATANSTSSRVRWQIAANRCKWVTSDPGARAALVTFGRVIPTTNPTTCSRRHPLVPFDGCEGSVLPVVVEDLLTRAPGGTPTTLELGGEATPRVALGSVPAIELDSTDSDPTRIRPTSPRPLSKAGSGCDRQRWKLAVATRCRTGSALAIGGRNVVGSNRTRSCQRPADPRGEGGTPARAQVVSESRGCAHADV